MPTPETARERGPSDILMTIHTLPSTATTANGLQNDQYVNEPKPTVMPDAPTIARTR